MTPAREHFEERAAVFEFDAGMTRQDAEIAAMGEVAKEFGWPAVVAMAKEGGV